MENEWKHQLIPFDTELALMVESLLGTPCDLKNGGDAYFFVAKYGEYAKDPDYLAAVCRAIEGRAGERLVGIDDDPDLQQFIVRVKFSKSQYPSVVCLQKDGEQAPGYGQVYCRKMEEIRALQVTRGNAERLLHFVGNGEMEIEKRPSGKATFHFLNAGGSVYAHAPEGSYLVYVSPGRFKIVDQETFEREYEKK